jgi:hypothetical protein
MEKINKAVRVSFVGGLIGVIFVDVRLMDNLHWLHLHIRET